jgi:hypothetical protein
MGERQRGIKRTLCRLHTFIMKTQKQKLILWNPKLNETFRGWLSTTGYPLSVAAINFTSNDFEVIRLA